MVESFISNIMCDFNRGGNMDCPLVEQELKKLGISKDIFMEALKKVAPIKCKKCGKLPEIRHCKDIGGEYTDYRCQSGCYEYISKGKSYNFTAWNYQNSITDEA